MTPFWTYVFAGIYTVVGLAFGALVAFERGIKNDPWWLLEGIASAIALPSLLHCVVMLVRRLWQ